MYQTRMLPTYGMVQNQTSYPYSNRVTRSMPNTPQSISSSDDRFGSFLFPFLLGGVTGGLVAPYFYQRPYYYNNYYYPYYGPYYRYY